MPKVVKALMPILEPGIWIPDQQMKSGGSCRGFTILEILVVVAVISIIASTILLNTSFNRPESKINQHVAVLGKTLKLLIQEAILNDKNYALSLVPGGYLVLEYGGQEWQQTEDRFFKNLQDEHAFSDELVIDNYMIVIKKQEKPQPHIFILASGEMTAFQWDIEDRANNLRVRLTSSLLGDITIEGPVESLQ